jgi:hypothetical protein
MKISEASAYSHPVLTPWSDDIDGPAMATTLAPGVSDDGKGVLLGYSAVLHHSELRARIEQGEVAYGIYIRCIETGLRELKELRFPEGTIRFDDGALLGRVDARPIVWAKSRISSYLPYGAHHEYVNPSLVEPGRPLALEWEQQFIVAHPSLPDVESIFQLVEKPELEEGKISVDASADKVSISVGARTHTLIQELRGGNEATRAVLMNALYGPAVMEILHQLQENSAQFDQYRWSGPFKARCDELGIDIRKPDLINDAQALLNSPFLSLARSVDVEE